MKECQGKKGKHISGWNINFLWKAQCLGSLSRFSCWALHQRPAALHDRPAYQHMPETMRSSKICAGRVQPRRPRARAAARLASQLGFGDHVSRNQNLVMAAAAIYGWDRPLLTFIYPSFDCGSSGFYRRDPSPFWAFSHLRSPPEKRPGATFVSGASLGFFACRKVRDWKGTPATVQIPNQSFHLRKPPGKNKKQNKQ